VWEREVTSFKVFSLEANLYALPQMGASSGSSREAA
jgi:hypothetical protein